MSVSYITIYLTVQYNFKLRGLSNQCNPRLDHIRFIECTHLRFQKKDLKMYDDLLQFELEEKNTHVGFSVGSILGFIFKFIGFCKRCKRKMLSSITNQSSPR